MVFIKHNDKEVAKLVHLHKKNDIDLDLATYHSVFYHTHSVSNLNNHVLCKRDSIL